MKIFAYIVLITLASAASAEPWYKEGEFFTGDALTDTLFVAYNLTMLADWAQTRYIADNLAANCNSKRIVTINGQERSSADFDCDGGYFEDGLAKNFIGESPTTREVDKYFITSIAFTNAAGYFLPEETSIFGFTFNPKKIFYVSVSVYEAYYVKENYQLGIRGDFN